MGDILYSSHTQDAIIESNNGGRGFARNVKRILWDTFRSRRTRIIDRDQRSNKQSRILSQATFVMTNIFYPADWNERWPRYYAAMCSYMRKGRNAHDDAPDATTGLAEYMQGGSAQRSHYYSGKGARSI